MLLKKMAEIALRQIVSSSVRVFTTPEPSRSLPMELKNSRVRSTASHAPAVIAVMIVAVTLAITSRALATSGTWTDTTSGGLWSTMGDWSGGSIANGTDGIADFSTLNITSDDTVHLDSSRTIGQLKFGDTTPSNNWILDSNGLPNSLFLGVTSGSPTIAVSSGMATIDVGLGGTQGLTKSGVGALILGDGNTLTGSIAISAGTLALGNANALSTPSNAVSVTAGATLDLGGQTIGANTLAISGTGVGGNGALINSSATAASFAGTITVSAPLTVGGNGDITLSGSVNSNTNVLTKIGNDTLTLSGATDNNNLAVTVNAGTVVLAKTSSGVHAIGQAVLFVNGGVAQLAGTGGDQIFDSGSVTVTSGAFDTNGQSEIFATLSLQGTGIGNAGALVNSAGAGSTIQPTGGTTLTGNATIGVTQSNGGIQLANAIGGNFALTKTGPGSLLLGGTNTFSGGLTVAQGTLAIYPAPNNAGTNGVLGNNTSVTLGSSGQTGTLEFIGTSGASNMPFTLATGGTGEFQVFSGSNIQLSGAIGGSGALFLTAGGTLTLSGNNTFTGGVTIDGGTGNGGTTLQVGSAGALNASAPNAVTFGAATTTEMSAPTMTLGGFSVAVSGLNVIADNSGFVPIVQNASPTAASLTVNIAGAVNDSFDGFLSDGTGGGPLSLIKTGSGTLTLVETSGYTGATTISGGTLRLGGDGVNTLGVIASASVVDNGVLEFAIPVALLPLLRPTITATMETSAALARFIKSGSGMLTLTGNNTFTGTTTISGGTLVMAGGALTSNVLNQATFAFDGGTFGGRLTNQGTATFNADFSAGNGMENDAIAATAAGVNLTFNGAGLNNEGTLTASGGTVTVAGTANVNRGNLNLSNLNLAGATLINNGSLVFTGGLVSGVSGSLINAVGGTISGTANITTGFSNAGGTLLVGAGTINITSNFSNSGLIQLTAANADLVGGTIGNPAAGTIQGLGIIGNTIVNAGTIESTGGTLNLNGQLTNVTGGLLAVDAGSKMLVFQGLTANAGIINLTGGTFDNGGLALSNGATGQISGWGIIRTGGLTNNGSITFSGGLTTVNGPVTNENGSAITIAQNPAIFTGLVTNNGGGTFKTVSTTATFAGGFTNNGTLISDPSTLAFTSLGYRLEWQHDPKRGFERSLSGDWQPHQRQHAKQHLDRCRRQARIRRRWNAHVDC